MHRPSPTRTPQRTTPTRPRTTPSASHPARAGQSISPAVTPSRRPVRNPFASPSKALSFRVAAPPSSESTLRPATGDDGDGALFTFPVDEPQLKLEPEPAQPTEASTSLPSRPLARHVSNLSTALPLEEYMQSSAERSPTPPKRERSAMTPSQALAELGDLPDGALDEYMPTPTVKEEVPSQLPPDNPSSSRTLASDDDMDVDDNRDDLQSPPSAHRAVEAASQDETDVETAVKLPIEPTLRPTKKHVMFQLEPSESSSSAPSGATTPTPSASTSASQRSATPLQTSQNTTDCASLSLLFLLQLRTPLSFALACSRFRRRAHSSHLESPSLGTLVHVRRARSNRRVRHQCTRVCKPLLRRLQRPVL